MNSELNRSRHRQLTRFLCQELLYEYVRGGLNTERQLAVDQFINGCHESQQELMKLRRGVDYADQAAQMRLSAELKEALLNFEPQWKKRLRALSLWSSRRGWKLLPYFFVALAATLGFFVFRPMLAEINLDLTLAEQDRAERVETVVNSGESENSPAKAATSTNESPAAEAIAPQAAQPLQAPLVAPVEGKVFQIDVQSAEFSAASSQIRDKISALGGKSEGNEEMGALRKPGLSYFHFSMPAAARGEFTEFLKGLGKVRLREQKNSRVMPEGQLRFELNLKDIGEPKSEPATEGESAPPSESQNKAPTAAESPAEAAP